MYLQNNNRPLDNSGIVEQGLNNTTNLSVNSVKNRLHGIEFNKFKGTPSHLEELLNNGSNLGIVVINALDNTLYNYERRKYIELNQSLNNTVRVYFSVEDSEKSNEKKLFIYNGKVKQEVSNIHQPYLYNHFFENVNMYKNN